MVSSSGTEQKTSDRSEHKAAGNKKAEKREIAKGKILHATLDLIADEGLASLSHRNIAKAAGVQLAMTTYYFGTLENLIESAFDLHVERVQPWRDEIEQRADDCYRQFALTSGGGETPVEDMDAYVEALTALVVEIIFEEATEKKKMISAECQFVFAQYLPDALDKKVRALDESLWDIAEKSCRRLGSSSPRVDGQLLLFTMRELQLISVRSRFPPDLEMMTSCVGRLLRGFQLQDVPAVAADT
ncbi:TetR/AcrR family transcriptional regulator [Microbulbifer pacificus]|uniref:TetR family transcriptional regulator n=1 Tax=Microbulbifer pacificus TaxID=407164 RepID=A0AAU0MW91_9GAMM|nr:TetR family transcriptional regulator [Microbulbifer pacificus]WOX04321.1 TetR family transcriptional regulator [Microbulbifer pacificus]